jgi:N,N'-diacetyllegionaminate synthase
MNDRVTIIAEAGVNHNGDLNLAKKLIDVASDAGADFVKFQTFKALNLVTKDAKKASYQLAANSQESQHDMLRRLELTEEMHYELLDYCSSRKIGFLSTAFDIQSVDFLLNLGQKFFKIPSGEIDNLPYLRHIGKLGLPIFLSTGMSTMDDIQLAIGALEGAGVSRDRIVVLHCTTEYPAPMNDVNLRAMLTIKNAFNVVVGYSDHTLGIEVAIAAVAMGAKVIEKHFTLDRNLAGPDHKASLEPEELRTMILAIRNIEIALGNDLKAPTSNELSNKLVSRKSIVASRTINIGDVFTVENIAAKRPGTGISPMRWDEIIGQRAKRAFSADDLIEL